MSAVDSAKRELDALDLNAEVVTSEACTYPPVLMFNYTVQSGPHRGSKFRMGISFQEDAYPEYPPHFVHIASLPCARHTKFSEYTYEDLQWSVFSLPPSDFWDELPLGEKNMKTYIRRHLARVWAQI